MAEKKLVDYRKIEVEGDKVRLGKGQRVGLGGIAKGYIVDKVARLLRDGGLEAFLVQAGGDAGPVVTHLAYTAAYDGPYPFDDEDGQAPNEPGR